MIFDYALGDSNTMPSIQDYKFLKFNVGELTADVINPAVRNNMPNSIAKLNALFSNLPSAYSAFVEYTHGKGKALTVEQYNTLGINSYKYGGVDNVNNQLKYSNAKTIKSAQDYLENLLQLIEYINGEKNELSEGVTALLQIEISQVGSLANLQGLLREKKITELNELRKRVKAFEVVFNYTNSNGTKPTSQDYVNAGFPVANVDMDALNSIVKGIQDFTMLKEVLEKAAQSWKVIEDYKNGKGNDLDKPTIDDYRNIGLPIKL